MPVVPEPEYDADDEYEYDNEYDHDYKDNGQRVVNGTNSVFPLPYQLQVRSNGPFNQHICGAALISSRFALSANHCFDSSYASKTIKDYELVAGKYRKDTEAETVIKLRKFTIFN